MARAPRRIQLLFGGLGSGAVDTLVRRRVTVQRCRQCDTQEKVIIAWFCVSEFLIDVCRQK